MKYDSSMYIEYAEFEVELEYNTFKTNKKNQLDGRKSRDIDRFALIIYGQDDELKWHVRGFADAEGNIKYAEPVQGNSTERTISQPTPALTRQIKYGLLQFNQFL